MIGSASEEGHLVFVYGTLRRKASNAFRMEGGEFLGSGFVEGCLFKVDWYPGVLLKDGGGTVVGELWRVDTGMLVALDEFEGPEYRRVSVEISLESDACRYDDRRTAWIWEWDGPTDGLEFIESGDWLAFEGSK